MDPHPMRSPQYQQYHTSMAINSNRSSSGNMDPDNDLSKERHSVVYGQPLPLRPAATFHHRQAQPQPHPYLQPYMPSSLSQPSLIKPSSPSTSAPDSASRSLSVLVSIPSAPVSPLPPLPPQSQEHLQTHNLDNSAISETTNAAVMDSTASDLVQHCLLFPTYATRYSRSGSKDPLDWNIRVRGWAFSKRSNRRKRLVMSVARKIAGVTKDNNKGYETLESRFGMFLATNTQGAQFAIQCIGLASITHMEMVGDSEGDDPTVEVLMDELKSADGAMAEADVLQDKEQFRKSLEYGQRDVLDSLTESKDKDIEHSRQNQVAPPTDHTVDERPETHEDADQTEQLKSPAAETHVKNTGKDINNTSLGSPSNHSDGRLKYAHDSEIPHSQLSTAENESTFTGRLSKGAAIIKGAIKKYRVMSHVSGNDSTDSLKHSSAQGQLGTRTNNNVSDWSASYPNKPGSVSRGESGDTVLTQMTTQPENPEHGDFPTIHVSSRLGGHFEGTLRMSHTEVEAYRKQDTSGGHPQFLKLHALHAELPNPSHGVVNLIEPEGISIISDIDDTIKETNVTAGARIILRNTFLRDMRDVKGMAAVYKKWWSQGAAMHYVSNSPWQLIPSLLEFFHTHMFPPGSAHLRLHDGVLKTYFTTPGENKRRAIKEILTDFPDRKFILVGDSGEIDMEIYTEMALAYPKQIFRIFIHDITTTRLKGIASRTSPTRSHSLSSLLSKTPISTGFGLFNRRGSGAATPTSTQSSIGLPSANLSTTSSLSTEDEEVEDQIPIVTTPEELSEEEVSMMKEKTQELNFEGHRHHGESFTPTLEPSDPLTAPAALLPSSTRSSPKLQPRQIAAGVKAVTNSLLTSTFKRSPSNSKLNGSGWGASKHSGGNISPSSPLATHSTTSVNAYPFPTVASESSTSISVSATQEGSTTDNKPDGTETDEDDKKNAIRTISRNASDSASKDIFEDGDHQHVTLQHQHHKHQHIEVQGPGQHIQSTRTRTTTFTYAYSQSFPGSTPDVTFASGSTPTHSPTPSPRIPIHGARKTGGITSGFTSTSTVDITSISLTATSLSTSPVSGPVLSPISPSVSSSSSAVKNPLVIWQERIEQCQRKLPEGMLTLFTSADELDQCQVVKSMFENYGEKSSGSGNRGDSSSERSSSPLLVSLSGGSSTSVESAHCCAEGVADRTAVNGIPVFTSSVAAD